jgi:hypothetical protein
MPVILATQEMEIMRITVQSQPGQIVLETLSRKTHHKKGLVEWLKVKALSSSPSTEEKKKTAVWVSCCCSYGLSDCSVKDRTEPVSGP